MRLFLLFVFATAAFAQTFEVASIRPTAPITREAMMAGKVNFGLKVETARVTIGFVTLRDLLAIAYDVKPYQINGPDWIGTGTRFDVAAKLPEGATKDQVPAMVRALLEERFKLKAHKEKKEQNIYSLEVGKDGHKMKDAPPAEPPPAEPPKDGMVVNAGGQQLRINQTVGTGGRGMVISGSRAGNTRVTMGENGMMRMEMERVTMPELAQAVTPMLDRPVLDHTGLPGAYQVALELAMVDMMQMARAMAAGGAAGAGPGMAPRGPVASSATPQASDPAGGSIFKSIQELGLRLDRQKAEIDTVFVDSVEKEPTEN